jgi:diaminopropionate ammonia-lyase
MLQPEVDLPPVSASHRNRAANSPGPGAVLSDDPRAVHRSLPGYRPTPLRESPALAAAIGVRRLWVKDEGARFGLPSFKILGAAYALHRALRARLGDTGTWESFGEWQRAAAALGPLTLVTATDGNHGRAVAHLARRLGFGAVVLVPGAMAAARIAAIRQEGAEVRRIEGGYDDAVAMLAEFDHDRDLVLSDTSWEGYETIPRWVIDGYTTIFAEIDEQLARGGVNLPDLVIIQAGVGALASGAVRHWTSSRGLPPLVTVEPQDAACVLEALARGGPRQVPAPHRSIMAGLNCGLVSRVALPLLESGVKLAVAIDDAHAAAAVRLMHAAGFAAGETGAAGFAGLLALRTSDSELQDAAGLDQADDVLIVCTETVTDPALTDRLLTAPPIPAG